ncbi:hypothetical protein HQ29_04475 [Porphyromonas canoris]|nr:hypothetical protein HQ29_04475 [Porphyromonas canoris]
MVAVSVFFSDCFANIWETENGSAGRAVFIYSIPKNAHFFSALYFDRRGCFQRGAEFVKSAHFINTIFDTC